MPEANFYQSFWYNNNLVRIPTHVHPTLRKPFVIWSDIEHCFPGATRIQNGDCFVPLLRDERLYRQVNTYFTPYSIGNQPIDIDRGTDLILVVCGSYPQFRTSDSLADYSRFVFNRCKPHGIGYIPDVVLTVVCEADASKGKQPSRSRQIAGPAKTTAVESAIPEVDTFDIISTDAAPEHGPLQRQTGPLFEKTLADRMMDMTAEIVRAAARSKQPEARSGQHTPKTSVDDDDEGDDSSNNDSSLLDVDISGMVASMVQDALTPFLNDMGKRCASLDSILEKVASQAMLTQEQDTQSIAIKPKVPVVNGTSETPAIQQHPKKPSAKPLTVSALMTAPSPVSTSSPSATKDTSGSPNVGSVDVNNAVKDTSTAINHDTRANGPGKTPATTGMESNGNNKPATAALDDKVGTLVRSAKAVKPIGGAVNKHQGKPSPLRIEDIVMHRGKEILAKRYNWIESPCSKLFYILPRREDVSSALINNMTWHDFDVHFLCDCGDIVAPGKSASARPALPHREPSNGHQLLKEAKAFGPYLMAVLEMLEYGVTIDGEVKVRALTQMNERKMVMYSMAFLMLQGVKASHQFSTEGCQSLDEIKPVAPLSDIDLLDLYTTRINTGKPYGKDYAIRTDQGDIRWICSYHRRELFPDFKTDSITDFVNAPENKKSSWDPETGTLFALLQSKEQARSFYQRLPDMSMVLVLTVFLDWDLSEEDELHLQLMIPQLTCACVKIMVPEREEEEHDVIPGFGHGFFGAILAAIFNTNIQAFSIEKRLPEDGLERPCEFMEFRSSSLYLDPVMARFTRSSRDLGIELGLLVTDIDHAVVSIREGLGGYFLSKLTLEAPHWERVQIHFGDSEGDIPDKGCKQESEIEFFNRRSHDVITIRTYESPNVLLLQTHCLKDVSIRFTFPADGPRIREMIKNNIKLQRIELVISNVDDPCQIFEYFKAVMTNHPSLEYFQLDRDRVMDGKSNFVWSGVADRAKMTLAIQSDADDKIGSLLQKYGTSLYKLWIHGISNQDAAILEKVTRTRKTQLKLTAITLCDACSSIPQQALDDLAKVVLRTPLTKFAITGTVIARMAPRLADFMTTVAPKITGIHLFGEQSKAIVTELAKRAPDSANMNLLTELKIGGPFDAATKDLTWFKALFNNNVPLTMFELRKVNLSHQGWMTLAQEVDFKRLHYFRVAPEVPLKSEAISAFVMAVPDQSELENFHLDTDGHSENECLAYKLMLEPRLKKNTALVSIGRYY
ncbi:hypothetical protein EMPS_04277 [Entomortierella parvispora]|uniref:Uncharacterized protein n=1 Tax=Entomortierella parvispora TaxID=205924 RepID=A0A9P3LVN1_9FUNG|nr:hypothetical protein EMPS_04277 [Entomortierella parvispora]